MVTYSLEAQNASHSSVDMSDPDNGISTKTRTKVSASFLLLAYLEIYNQPAPQVIILS